MNEDIIPEDIKAFILQHIDSIAEWEALLLLRNNPHIEWNAEKVAERLYINWPESALLLAKLAARGFLTMTQDEPKAHYRYQTKHETMEEKLGDAAELYSRHLVPITNLIHSKPKSRIQKFADAFRIRKD